MSTKKKTKTGTDLSIKDQVFAIESDSMIEHMKVDDSVNLRHVKYYSISEETVKELALSENEDEVIINGKLHVPIRGKMKPKVSDILTDEKEAVALVLLELEKERKYALELSDLVEQIIGGLKNNIKVHQERAKKLGIVVQVDDDKNEVIIQEDEPE